MTIVIDPTLAPPAGITLDHLVNRVRQTLTHREELNLLVESIDATETELSLKYSLSGLSRGVELSIDDELMYVWDADNANKTVTVRRGYGGSTAAQHAAGADVCIGGKSRKAIVDAINDELSSVSGKGLYQMRTVSLSGYSPSVYAYPVADLDESVVYDVEARVTGQPDEWVHLPGWTFSSIDSTLTFGTTPWSSDVRILYKAGFGTFVGSDDDIQSDVGLHPNAADVLVYGAAFRLITPDELSRNDPYTQGDTRRPQEVPPGAILRYSAGGLKAIHDDRLSEEKDRLRRRFPSRRAGW